MGLPLATGKGNWSMDEINENFKPTFEGRSRTMYSTKDPLEGAIKKNFKFTGSEKKIETHLSYAGGFGSRFLPKANNSKMANQVITAKKVYGRALVDREGLKAASNSQGAYQTYLKMPIKKTVENYSNQCGRINFGDGTGILGRGDGATAVTGAGTEADPYLIYISAASFKDTNWEEKSFVQIVTGLAAFPDNSGGAMEGGDNLTNILEVVSVDVATRCIGLIGVSAHLAARVAAPGALAATVGLCMQRSYNGEPTGFNKVLMAEDGDTLYGIEVQRRWKAGQLDADGSGLLVDMLNEVSLERQHIFGEEFNMIVCRYNQFQKLLAQLEEKKSIQIKNVNVKGHLGFKGVEFVTSTGKECAIVVNRHADADKVYCLNTAYINRLHRPDFGWFDEDGTVFMRVQDSDELEARYGGYWENVMVPTAHAVIHNLAV